ncbi:hypothetical protein RB195_001611 [Necator americanus]|uniref:Uncharacterized protein n=1 Tax=Necator americanus TaxID=51031 RepID=A0ABR1DFQ4_NECAM
MLISNNRISIGDSEQRIHELEALQNSQDDKVTQQSAEQRELCEQQKMNIVEMERHALLRGNGAEVQYSPIKIIWRKGQETVRNKKKAPKKLPCSAENAEQKIEGLEREVDILKMEKEQLKKIANYSSCNKVGELKRYLAIKDDYMEYLGKQCDEFDELEVKYKQEMYKERDRLKAQTDASNVPVAPVLAEKTCLLDAYGKRLPDEEEFDERSDKDHAFKSAPSSPTPSKSFDSIAGPALEESTTELAAVTPNRTLHFTLYK